MFICSFDFTTNTLKSTQTISTKYTSPTTIKSQLVILLRGAYDKMIVRLHVRCMGVYFMGGPSFKANISAIFLVVRCCSYTVVHKFSALNSVKNHKTIFVFCQTPGGTVRKMATRLFIRRMGLIVCEVGSSNGIKGLGFESHLGWEITA